MLIAPNDPIILPDDAEATSPRAEAAFNYFLIALSTGILTYTLVTGFSLASGRISVDRSYSIMVPIPLLLAIWHLYGFSRQKAAQRDMGLAVGGAGWLGVVLTLLLKHSAVSAAVAQGLPVTQASDGAFTWIVAFLSIALLVGGAVLSVNNWNRINKASQTY